MASSRLDILVEEDSGADDKLEDVLQSLHGLQQLFCQLLGVVNVVLQDFGQLPKTHTHTHKVEQISSSNLSISHWMRILKGFSNSRIGQRGTEMLPYVGLQNRVKVLKFSVCYESNYEHLSGNRDTFIKM